MNKMLTTIVGLSMLALNACNQLETTKVTTNNNIDTYASQKEGLKELRIFRNDSLKIRATQEPAPYDAPVQFNNIELYQLGPEDSLATYVNLDSLKSIYDRTISQ